MKWQKNGGTWGRKFRWRSKELRYLHRHPGVVAVLPENGRIVAHVSSLPVKWDTVELQASDLYFVAKVPDEPLNANALP